MANKKKANVKKELDVTEPKEHEGVLEDLGAEPTDGDVTIPDEGVTVDNELPVEPSSLGEQADAGHTLKIKRGGKVVRTWKA